MCKITIANLGLSNGKFGQVLWLSLLIWGVSTLPTLAVESEKVWHTLIVNGHGKEVIPTILSEVNLAVEVQAKTAQEAQQESANRSSALVALLKSRNVSKLVTTGVHLNPIYNYSNNVQRITGYAASNIVNFQITTDKAGTLLDEAVKVGASQINSVRFIASDQAIAHARTVALQKATQDAQEQANAVFNALGLKSKEIVSIQVNNASAPPQPILYRALATRQSSVDTSTPIVGGEQEVEASVTLQISY